MTQLTIQEIGAFLACYREITFAHRLQRLHAGYLETQARARAVAPHFNIFQVLDVQYREVKTHSAFLAHLLDPKGLHGQGHLFLKRFLDHCHDKQFVVAGCAQKPVPFTPPAALEGYDWQVRREFGTKHYGILDILIRCPELGCLYVIENKIGAPESERQLQFYYDWMVGQTDFPNSVLIYLTPWGRCSDRVVCAAYQAWSYREDVYEWLTAAIPEVAASSVKSVVEQYKDLIVRF
jgi:hypothetical protein